MSWISRVFKVRRSAGASATAPTAAPVTANAGISVPADFPLSSYEVVNSRAAGPHSTSLLYAEFAGGWIAVSYRFRGFIEAGLAFEQSIAKTGPSVSGEERYRQDQDLFVCAASALGAIEAACYALFAIGSMLVPSDFPLTTDQDKKKVSPENTSKAYGKAFPSDPLSMRLDALTNSTDFKQLKSIRNFLAHRATPGRTTHLGLSPGSPESRSTELTPWGIAVTPTTFTDWRAVWSPMLGELVVAADTFATTHL
jgi:hypothetical protein